ncbi:hypothetical protein A6R68_14393 [Neotoma lepida]|uniref:Large ribosomal subunit protein uL10 n=1 Tax=Neotoma lepida TaxID=56216 RepID=A0A1A6H9V5_NEOLE|nr:hypothetical protein A6R68_14393 [Neotoma lepida]
MAAAGLVAVAAAAEYSGPVASGGNLSGANCGPSPGVGPGSGPGSWSRSVDRALEEAAVTGVLSLSGRKLREFPRGAANHDLTDTTRAENSQKSELYVQLNEFKLIFVGVENLFALKPVLDITEQTLHSQFLEGVRNVASVCLQIGHPTVASVPHSIISGYKRVLVLSVETEYTFPLAEKVKAFLADSSAFVAAAPVAATTTAAPAAAAAPAKAEAKEESEESDEDMGFGLFD